MEEKNLEEQLRELLNKKGIARDESLSGYYDEIIKKINDIQKQVADDLWRRGDEIGFRSDKLEERVGLLNRAFDKYRKLVDFSFKNATDREPEIGDNELDSALLLMLRTFLAPDFIQSSYVMSNLSKDVKKDIEFFQLESYFLGLMSGMEIAKSDRQGA